MHLGRGADDLGNPNTGMKLKVPASMPRSSAYFT
jgi:hypothetical protein